MTRSTARGRACAAGLSLALLVGVSACGDDDSSTDDTAAPISTGAGDEAAPTTPANSTDAPQDASSEAQALLAALIEKPTQLQTIEPVGAEIPTGKIIDWIVCGVPQCTALTKPLTDAAAVLGWTVNSIDAGLTPETVQAAWNLAVENKHDAVVGTGFPTVMYSDALAQLKDAGIPVVIGYVTEEPADNGVIAVIAGGPDIFGLQGKVEAQFVVGRVGEDADTVFLGGSTFPGIDAVQDGYETEYKRLCPDCEFDALDIAGAAIGTTLPGDVVAYLETHPSVNYLVLGQASMALGLPQALEAAGSEAKIVTNFPDTSTAQMLAEGQIDGMIMFQQGDSMWQMVDALARHFAGVSVEPSMVPSPAWAITKDNVDQLTGDPYVLIDGYQEQYKALWGK